MALLDSRGVKDAIEIFLGLADVFADDAGKIDFVEVETELGRDHSRSHRFAGARSPGEENFETQAGGNALVKSPL